MHAVFKETGANIRRESENAFLGLRVLEVFWVSRLMVLGA